MFLSGRVATADGTPIPANVLVERVCNNSVRHQIYAFIKGDFTMQLGSRVDSFLDASAGATVDRSEPGRDPDHGIPRRELTNCELRANAPGFHPVVVSLMGLDTVAETMDVGVLVVSRSEKVDGMTVSAIPYKAPKDALKAYEKGLAAVKNSKLAEARKYFERAVGIYPQFAYAWFQLGSVLQKENQGDAAGKAYAQAATIDSKFERPYLALAAMAFADGKWNEVADLTRHLLDLDPFRQSSATGYVLDLDPLDYGEAYFYDAFANYKLKRFAEAEKSGLKAERMDMRPRFPRVHLLLAEIFARKGDYANAITETKTYLELVPHARNAVRVRERMAEFERLNGAVANAEGPAPK